MDKPRLPQLIKSARTTIAKHSPEILMGFGIAGMIATTVLAVRATPKAMRCIEEAEYRKEREEGSSFLTPLETVQATWKCYIPAVVTGVASTACLIGSCSVNMRRNAALTAAYKLSETALSEYKEQVIESIGEKKEQHIQEKVNQKQIEKIPMDKNKVYVTGKGNTLFLEPLSQRYFRSDIDRIRRAENVLNKQMLHSIYGTVTLNEFYDEIGLEHTDLGDNMGWNTERMIDLNITPGMTDDEEPCLVIGHYVRPEYIA